MYKIRRRQFGVIIGRFQPFHYGHKALLEEALSQYEKVCIVLGSAHTSPSIKNPFTPEAREEMIRKCMSVEDNEKLVFVSVRDYPYNINNWLSDVRNKVSRSLQCQDGDVDLVGHYKDRSSFYLKLFPSWQFNEACAKEGGLSSTHVREKYLAKDGADALSSAQLPQPVVDFMTEFSKTETFENLVEEYDMLRKYKKDTQFVNAKFPPTFVTVDAVVVQSGHVLVVKRKFNPGKGKMALPGGFIKSTETLEDSCIRELKEETKIRIAKPILKANIKERHLFDDPNRSLRGRTITTAFFIPLPENLKHGLPMVEGDDDAAEAFWLPLSDVARLEDEFFEDHSHIIRYFTKTL